MTAADPGADTYRALIEEIIEDIEVECSVEAVTVSGTPSPAEVRRAGDALLALVDRIAEERAGLIVARLRALVREWPEDAVPQIPLAELRAALGDG